MINTLRKIYDKIYDKNSVIEYELIMYALDNIIYNALYKKCTLKQYFNIRNYLLSFLMLAVSYYASSRADSITVFNICCALCVIRKLFSLSYYY